MILPTYIGTTYHDEAHQLLELPAFPSCTDQPAIIQGRASWIVYHSEKRSYTCSAAEEHDDKLNTYGPQNGPWGQSQHFELIPVMDILQARANNALSNDSQSLCVS
jgi:hypothetical protein